MSPTRICRLGFVRRIWAPFAPSGTLTCPSRIDRYTCTIPCSPCVNWWLPNQPREAMHLSIMATPPMYTCPGICNKGSRETAYSGLAWRNYQSVSQPPRSGFPSRYVSQSLTCLDELGPIASLFVEERICVLARTLGLDSSGSTSAFDRNRRRVGTPRPAGINAVQRLSRQTAIINLDLDLRGFPACPVG